MRWNATFRPHQSSGSQAEREHLGVPTWKKTKPALSWLFGSLTWSPRFGATLDHVISYPHVTPDLLISRSQSWFRTLRPPFWSWFRRAKDSECNDIGVQYLKQTLFSLASSANVYFTALQIPVAQDTIRRHWRPACRRETRLTPSS